MTTIQRVTMWLNNDVLCAEKLFTIFAIKSPIIDLAESIQNLFFFLIDDASKNYFSHPYELSMVTV